MSSVRFAEELRRWRMMPFTEPKARAMILFLRKDIGFISRGFS